MCLAVPAKVEDKEGDMAWVRIGDARVRINVVMTPEIEVGGWVLVHAGFSIQIVEEEEAQETWRILEQIRIIESDGSDIVENNSISTSETTATTDTEVTS